MNASTSLKIKSISERISIAESSDESGNITWSVVVLPLKDKLKLIGLGVWILLWTICGLLIIGSYKLTSTQEQKIFIIVFTFFWLYYEWKTTKVFLWRRWGKEKLWLKNKILVIENIVMNQKSTQAFRIEDINSIEAEEFNETSFFDYISNSFWSKGKPRIKFNVLGKNLYFAHQINDKETKEIIRELKKAIEKSK